jgi:hypothetical protein
VPFPFQPRTSERPGWPGRSVGRGSLVAYFVPARRRRRPRWA